MEERCRLFLRSGLWCEKGSMIRVALTHFLMLSVLAGQCFCCCTSVRPLANLAPTPQRVPLQPTPQCQCCCCQTNQVSENQSERVGEKSPTKSNVPKMPPCPCREKKSQSVAAVPLEREKSQDWQARHLLQHLGDSVSVPLVSSDLSQAGSFHDWANDHILPFLTAQDMLRAHHLLRC